MVINLGITNTQNIDLALKIHSCDVTSTMQRLISLKMAAELWCQLKMSSRHPRCNYLLFLECPTLFFDEHLFAKCRCRDLNLFLWPGWRPNRRNASLHRLGDLLPPAAEVGQADHRLYRRRVPHRTVPQGVHLQKQRRAAGTPTSRNRLRSPQLWLT